MSEVQKGDLVGSGILERSMNELKKKTRDDFIAALRSEVALAAVANIILSHTARNEKYEDLPNKVIGRPMRFNIKEADCKTFWRGRASEMIEAAIKASEKAEAAMASPPSTSTKADDASEKPSELEKFKKTIKRLRRRNGYGGRL